PELANDTGARHCLRRAQATIAGVAAAAFAFNQFTSPGYFDDFYWHLGAMAVAAVPAALLHLLATRDTVRRPALTLLQSPFLHRAAVTVIVLLAIYAGFI